MEKMTLSALLILLLTYVQPCPYSLVPGPAIGDGNLWQLSKMIRHATGKTAIFNYSTYGCYCGLGGHGQPVDLTDWCCHQHDCCYHKVEKAGINPKWAQYSYTMHLGTVRCGDGTRGQRETCQCDQSFVQCLQKHVASYRKAYRFHWNSRCAGQTPSC